LATLPAHVDVPFVTETFTSTSSVAPAKGVTQPSHRSVADEAV
jgi:hypothetical protein